MGCSSGEASRYFHHCSPHALKYFPVLVVLGDHPIDCVDQSCLVEFPDYFLRILEPFGCTIAPSPVVAQLVSPMCAHRRQALSSVPVVAPKPVPGSARFPLILPPDQLLQILSTVDQRKVHPVGGLPTDVVLDARPATGHDASSVDPRALGRVLEMTPIHLTYPPMGVCRRNCCRSSSSATAVLSLAPRIAVC